MRKTSILTIASLCVAFISHAQISKGSLFLGGSFGINRQTETSSLGDSKQTSWSFNPAIGLAVKENTITGVTLFYSGATTSSSDTKNHGFGGGVFLRKYKTLGKGFYLFGEGNALFNYSKFQANYPGGSMNSQRINSIVANIFPGVSYAVSKHFYLETTLTNLFSVYYSATKIQNQNGIGQSVDMRTQKSVGANFGAGGNIPINLGFRFIFPKRK